MSEDCRAEITVPGGVLAPFLHHSDRGRMVLEDRGDSSAVAEGLPTGPRADAALAGLEIDAPPDLEYEQDLTASGSHRRFMVLSCRTPHHTAEVEGGRG